MRVTKSQLRRIIKEQLDRLNELNWADAAAALDVDPQIQTVGDLRTLIQNLQSEKRAEKGIEGLKDLGMGALADLVPGGGTVLSIGQILKGMYGAPDDKKTNTMLDKLNVDDDVAAIVDDTVEDNFVDQALEALEGLPDDALMPNITKELSDWLEGKYSARTVAGFTEARRVRITEHQLRRIIREAMGPLPMDLVRQTQWPAEKDPLTALRDGLIELGPDAENLFSMLVLDLGSSPQEVAENLPELASVLRGADQQTLLDVAESL